jgi:D-alanyl-D-alanine carboxypeptidase/D-alanyl-D-alanine-endopeptidase (penicillin-binding protein 4)
MKRATLAAALPLMIVLAAAAGHPADRPLSVRVEARLRAEGTGTRYGLLVVDQDGHEIVSINPDDRFIPASNTKIFTTAAAFATLSRLDEPDRIGGASVRLEQDGVSPPDVILSGHGDARLSSAADCAVDCLAELAAAVASRTRRVRNVVGDDSWFPDERWSSGMSWNNIPTRSGTGISALTLDNNEIEMVVTPTAPGLPPAVALPAFVSLDNRALTVTSGRTDLGYERLPGSTSVRLTGQMVAGAPPERLRLGIDDPALYAARRFRALLVAAGVRVTGRIDVRHRPLSPGDDPRLRGSAPPARAPLAASLATLLPPPLAADLVLTNKSSQNLHAELLLRRIGRERGSGSVADGLAAVRAMLADARVPRTAYDLSDGSGMSTYNRVSPRGMVVLLWWIARQPWGERWRATLPVGGIDGTLARRFAGTPLAGKLFAKTGSLNATAALSGTMVAASGRTLTFASYANDIPEGAGATRAVDAALLMIAAAN